MTSQLLRASLVVGGIGVIAALPLLALLADLHPAANRRTGLGPSVVVLIFVVAALFYAVAFRLLPASRHRSRAAGVIAALLTYCAVSVLYTLGVGLVRGRPYTQGETLALAAFALIGWLPAAAGFLAGWMAERWVMRSSNYALERTGNDKVPKVKPHQPAAQRDR